MMLPMALFRVLKNPAPVAALGLASLLLATYGCGGGKGGPSGSRGVSVTASPKSIAYGGETTVRWSASGTSSFGSSNFGVGEPDVRGGTLVDRPGTTTTYELAVNTPGGDRVGRATVTVAKAAEGALVVGDASRPGPNQMASFARTLTSGEIGLSSAIPAPSDAYGVLMVSPTVEYSADLKARVKAWLDAGKGVVLCGRAPSVIATGERSEDDVSAIGSWFFGVGVLPGAGNGYLVRESPEGLVRLSAVIRTDYVDLVDFEGAIENFGPQVDPVVGGVLAAYAVPTGGRLVYSASPVGYGDEPGGSFQQAFESAFRWAVQ